MNDGRAKLRMALGNERLKREDDGVSLVLLVLSDD